MNIKEFKRNHAIRVMTWCKSNIGLNRRRHYLPILEWHSSGEDCGDYDFEDNIISVYKSQHNSVLEIIHTIIHEWCHYKQSKKKYYKFDEEFGYNKNPLEIQADKIANELKFKCRKDLFY
jgi:hypothetical protein